MRSLMRNRSPWIPTVRYSGGPDGSVQRRADLGASVTTDGWAMNRSWAIRVARLRNGHAAKRRTASSFQSTPEPMASPTIAVPFSTRNGSASTGFHQSAYSSQCAVGVQHRRCALISGQRWVDMGIPFACASAAALSHPVTPPIFITSGMTKSDACASMACCMSSVPHQFSPHWIGVRASRATNA